jgi:hypothetical protein
VELPSVTFLTVLQHPAQIVPQLESHVSRILPFHYRANSAFLDTMEGPLKPTAASCPAKVLVAGGYLVLDRKYTALVFGLDARIHTVVKPISMRAGVTISEITVKSPQFNEAIWEYGYRSQFQDAGISVTQLSV